MAVVAPSSKPADCIILNANLATPRGGIAMRGKHMAEVDEREGVAIVIYDGIIECIGNTDEIVSQYPTQLAKHSIDAGGKLVTPALIDSHTHPIWAGSRAAEFARRIAGVSYQQIMTEGGGIASTVRATRQASDEQLHDLTIARIRRMRSCGTSILEAKSGYGLSVHDELRHLRILSKIKQQLATDMFISCLGAHSLPPEYHDDADGYIELVCKELLPQAADLCDFVDVFCDEGAFTLAQTERVLNAGKELGLGLRVHADEFASLGAVGLACDMDALSVDHLHCTTPEDAQRLGNSNTIATILPGTSFFLKEKEYSPARIMIEANAAVAIASDFNPGSCNCESLQSSLIIAALYLGMTPREILTAVTLNAAAALGIADKAGSIEAGKVADIAIWDVPHLAELIHHWGVNHLDRLVLGGVLYPDKQSTKI